MSRYSPATSSKAPKTVLAFAGICQIPFHHYRVSWRPRSPTHCVRGPFPRCQAPSLVPPDGQLVAPPNCEMVLCSPLCNLTFAMHTDNDGARFRQAAEECREQARRAGKPSDKEQWLRLAADWLRLAEDVEGRSGNS